MNVRLCALALLGIALLPAVVRGKNVLYDFESATRGVSTPLSLTAQGVQASFSTPWDSVYGYFVDTTSYIGVTPPGFSGQCLSPKTVYKCDLNIAFDHPLDSISLIWTDQELGTDTPAWMEMRVYNGANLVGSTTAQGKYWEDQGIWPSGTLSYATGAWFDNVVVHYLLPPVPASDNWGPIFLVDNVQVNAVPEPPTALIGVGLIAVALLRYWKR